MMFDPHYCDFCGCVCVACVQLGGCDDCELKHPEILDEFTCDLSGNAGDQ